MLKCLPWLETFKVNQREFVQLLLILPFFYGKEKGKGTKNVKIPKLSKAHRCVVLRPVQKLALIIDRSP